MPQNGETNQKFGFFSSHCCGKEIAVPKGSDFPACPNHPGLTSWIPIANDNIVQFVERRKSDRPAPRFTAGDQVTFVGAGPQKGKPGRVIEVTEGHIDFVNRYHVQFDDGSLTRCFGFELEGFENESSKIA
jgi:hypothetical protein